MAKKKNKKLKKIKKELKGLFSGNTFSGNFVSNILAAMIMEWWESRKEKRKHGKESQLSPA